MSKIHLLILTILLSLCTSCREGDQERVARLVQEWQGKEVVFPEGLVFTRFVKDTVDYRIPESDYKVLVYVDSVGTDARALPDPAPDATHTALSLLEGVGILSDSQPAVS